MPSLLTRVVLPAVRKALLALGRRGDPQRMIERSRGAAVAAAQHAARHSAAYRELLLEQGLTHVDAGVALERLPVLDKLNTFARFDFAQLARRVDPRDLADVLTSSGQGSGTFGYKVATRRSHGRGWFDIDLGLQDAFDIDTHSTLVVNCLPMGVSFVSRASTVANVSVREDMACSILRQIGPQFAQTLVCTDPLFVRRLLAQAAAAGVDWSALQTSLIIGEELLAESQRDYLALRMGIDLDGSTRRLIASSFGVAELGLNLLFESRETIRLRRAMRRLPEVAERIDPGSSGGVAPGLFCFNPMRCHIEVLQPGADGFGELCFTMLGRDAVIPLPRYKTGDIGRLIAPDEVAACCALAGCAAPWLPVVALRGRRSDAQVGLPSVDAVKEAIYADPALADGLTGAFRLMPAAPGASARGQLLLQADPLTPAGQAAAASIRQRLATNAVGGTAAELEVKIVAANDFPDRPLLDFERKLRYLQASTPTEP